ncbi:hypothetical protein SAMN04487850_2222 [Prevotella aff. ruminicola Tc2-24]|uniref:Lipoprotein n=1 Tax=Prevotella aff. ruminicola Tc2-24 TaxID=81582 RepID=A0A1I0Q4C2_9BACT|nr:hypothetical protein SAMN04487850_2222 [Prevotella aff. ruminicola Tc2-24]
MRRIVILFFCISFLQSCYTTRRNIDDQFVKQEIRIYKRVGDNYKVHYNILRMYIILKMTNSVYEIYTETAEGIMGKFSLRNDTLTLYHDFQLGFSDSTINVAKLNRKDTIPEFYPTKFIVRKDSLIDITDYYDFPEYQKAFTRPKENYILVR